MKYFEYHWKAQEAENPREAGALPPLEVPI